MYPNLRAELARKNWTVGYLASLLDISPSNMSLRMNGKMDFSLTEARSIKKWLGIDMTIDELFERDE